MADVSERSDLRLNVLNVVEEDFGNENFVTLNDFIGGKIPSGFGYSIRVCELGSETDYCNMRAPLFIATMDEDIYVEEIVISSELGDGTNAVYNPKKLRLFVWEGESIGIDCENECPVEGTIFSCSADDSKISIKECGNFDNDFCLEYNGTAKVFETCNEGDVCVEGLGICAEASNTFKLTCEKKSVSETGCVYNYDDECNEWNGGGRRTGDCGSWWNPKDAYECYNIESVVTECSENPVCPSGYSEVGRRSCSVFVEECEDTCSPARDVYSCNGDNTQVLKKTCGDFNGDGCLEWDSIKVFKTCGTTEMCKDGACVPSVAELSASISVSSTDITNPPYTKYNYDFFAGF